MTTTINQQVKENERLDKETSRNLLLSIKSQDNAVNIFEYLMEKKDYNAAFDIITCGKYFIKGLTLKQIENACYKFQEGNHQEYTERFLNELKISWGTLNNMCKIKK